MYKHTLSVEKLGKNIELTFDSNCLTIHGDNDTKKRGKNACNAIFDTKSLIKY